VAVVAAIAACGAPPAATIKHAAVAVAAPYRLGPLAIDGAPAIDPAIARALEPYARATGSRVLDLSADGATTLVAIGTQLVDIGPGGRHDRGEVPGVAWATFAPDGGLYVDAGADDDALRLWWLTPDGERMAVAPSHDVRQASPVYDAASDTLVWAENRDDRDGTELWRSRPGGAPELVAAMPAGTWEPVAIRGTRLIVRENAGALHAVLHEVTLEDDASSARIATGSATLAAANGSASVGVGATRPLTATGDAPLARFDRDGRLIALSDAGGELHGVVAIGSAGGHGVVTIAAAPDGHDLDAVAIAGDDTLVVAANVDGASALYAIEPRRGEASRLPGVPDAGVIGDVHAAGDAAVIAFTYSDAQHPRAAYRYDLASHALARVVGELAEPRAEDLEHDRARARDGAAVPLLVLRGRGARAPVVLELHGGPDDQWRPRFEPFEQFLASRGYSVVLANVRGSSGYGRSYATGDDGPHRGDVLVDVAAALDWIASQPDLDADRVVVMGASYGGYLALEAAVAYPDRLAGAIELAGMVDLPAFLAGTARFRADNRRSEYGDERVAATAARLRSVSPVAGVAQLREPLLIAHGRRDDRVPVGDAVAFAAAARAAGAPVWTLFADDEGHGFASAANRGAFEVLATQFLDEATTR
jgi:dipeptidyl aminopeptidase/acylaminoacyl peptidase